MFSKYNIRFKTLFPVIVTLIILIIIEVFRFKHFFYSDRVLRDFEHLIAGIMMPYVLHTFPYVLHTSKNNGVNFSCIAYAIASFAWEFTQFLTRGYFQFDQYLYDMIGVAIIFLLYNFKDMG